MEQTGHLLCWHGQPAGYRFIELEPEPRVLDAVPDNGVIVTWLSPQPAHTGARVSASRSVPDTWARTVNGVRRLWGDPALAGICLAAAATGIRRPVVLTLGAFTGLQSEILPLVESGLVPARDKPYPISRPAEAAYLAFCTTGHELPPLPLRQGIGVVRGARMSVFESGAEPTRYLSRWRAEYVRGGSNELDGAIQSYKTVPKGCAAFIAPFGERCGRHAYVWLRSGSISAFLDRCAEASGAIRVDLHWTEGEFYEWDWDMTAPGGSPLLNIGS